MSFASIYIFFIAVAVTDINQFWGRGCARCGRGPHLPILSRFFVKGDGLLLAAMTQIWLSGFWVVGF